ncbi:MAG: PQQ-dependent sugar dehydrogenase [Rhodothermales bacterium]|nr:PQQ-dependent sugar dehydrogenase [Rhodothermales bacterium]
MSQFARFIWLFIVVSIAGLTSSAQPAPAGAAGYTIQPFASGLDSPWGMAFLPDGRLLVTERIGTLRIVATDGTVSAPVEGVPEVCACGQGGLLDVQLHPHYQQNGWIYISYSDKKMNAAGEATGFTALMRARLSGNALIDQQMVYTAPEDVYSTREHHFGSRITFDDAGYLFFSIGDRGVMEDAQRLDVPNGKIHRLHDDGRVPADNPFVGQAGAVATIWSYGHRNPQGLQWNDGALWNTEHGPQGGDELNLVRKGLNFGWPAITYGINYNNEIISEFTEKEGMEQPATHWTPSIATCGIDFYDGAAFPGWSGDLFVTSLKFGELHRVEIDGTTVVNREVVLKTDGRLRDVETGPDGYLYIAIEGMPTSIVRLVPAGS